MKSMLNNYRIELKNEHLLDILSNDYYLELGVVDIDLLEDLIEGKTLLLMDLIYLDLANDGIGRIRKEDDKDDIFYQFNYLVSTRQKSSTNKFFLTCNALRFLNDQGYETYAPIVLIPVEIDYSTFSIVRSGEITPNIILINYLYKKLKNREDFQKVKSNLSKKLEFEERLNLLDIFKHSHFNSFESIDRYSKLLAEKFNLKYIIYNYLTTVKVEYHDYVTKDGFFDGELSVYSKEPSVIYKDFYQKVKAVLPTNIYQKQVLLKAANNEKFAVNGKLGSGKTYTALNIIADKLAKDNNILYVNQDIDNLFEMEKNLHILHLDNAVYNLSKNIKQIEFAEGKFNENCENEFDFSTIDELEKYNSSFDYKIHGFSKKLIYEDLAVLKRNNKVLEPIKIESNMEYFETTALYERLKIVEEKLNKIDAYENNCWKNIIVIHNNLTVDQIANRTRKMFEANKTLTESVEKFTNKYFLKMPKSINDLYTLNFCITEFDNHMPLKSWLEYDKRLAVKVAISELQRLSDIYYSGLEYYNNNIKKTYKHKSIDDIIKRLNLDIYNRYEVNPGQDSIYIDHLLNEKEHIKKLLSFCKTIQSDLLKYEKIFKEYFNVPKLEEYMLSMVEDLYPLLKNNCILKKWFLIAESSTDELRRLYNEYKLKMDQLLVLTKQIAPYVIKQDYLTFAYADEAAKSANFNRTCLKYFNRKVINIDHIDTSAIAKLYRNYYELQLEINHLIVDVTMIKKYPVELQYASFENFCTYMFKLSKLASKNIKYFFNEYYFSNKTNDATIVANFQNLLTDIHNFKDLESELRSYKIILNSYLYVDKAKELTKWQIYFDDVLRITEELKDIFIDDTNIDFARILELSKNDHDISDVKAEMKNKAAYFKDLLGESFNSFETDITSVSKLIEYFEDFSERFIDAKYIEQLFDENIFPNIVKESDVLIAQYNNWFDCFKEFSSCFRGGQAVLQRQSFKKNKENLHEFMTKLYQLEDVIYITTSVRTCANYHLKDLADGIRCGRYKNLVADRFYFSVLNKYRKELENISFDEVNTKEFLEKLDSYNKYELDYCTENINSLSKIVNKERRNTKINNIQFNDYNYLLQLSNNTRGIYLADLNIFNSNLNLNYFDLVIIDDAHLSTANKYNRLYECKQVIVFGDKSFNSSIVNTLMQRISDSSIVDFNNRYIAMSAKYNNSFTNNNQYILETKVSTFIKKYNDIDEFIDQVREVYYEDREQVLNIIVGSDISKRLIYSKLVDELVNFYDELDISTIFNFKIKIINSNYESATYADNVIFYFNDFLDNDENTLDLLFKNFSIVKRRIFIGYITNDSNTAREIDKKITHVTRDGNKYRISEGIVPLIINDLKKKFIRASFGFGSFDIIVKGKSQVGIIISGRKCENVYSYIDQANFYYTTYKKFGYHVIIIDVMDLVDNYQKVIDRIIEASKK